MAARADHPAVRKGEADGGEHVVEVVKESTAELREALKASVGRSRQPGTEPARHLPRFGATLLEEVGPAEGGVGPDRFRKASLIQSSAWRGEIAHALQGCPSSAVSASTAGSNSTTLRHRWLPLLTLASFGLSHALFTLRSASDP